MIIDHNHVIYRRKWKNAGKNKYNGAFYYSKEIVKNIIPNVETDRNWVTVNIQNQGTDHSIVFVHNNIHPERYDWLKRYHDIILVCGVPETVEKVAHIGNAIYLPLSVDVAYIEQFKTKKTKGAAFVGRQVKRKDLFFPEAVDFIENMPRERLLKRMAQYRRIYAVGRTAVEAKVLGCQVLPYDPRFPDPDLWQVLDNKDAAKILQKKINEIDYVKKSFFSFLRN